MRDGIPRKNVDESLLSPDAREWRFLRRRQKELVESLKLWAMKLDVVVELQGPFSPRDVLVAAYLLSQSEIQSINEDRVELRVSDLMLEEYQNDDSLLSAVLFRFTGLEPVIIRIPY